MAVPDGAVVAVPDGAGWSTVAPPVVVGWCRPGPG